MEKAIWICIIINLLAAVGLVVASFSPGQDAAGRSMILLPTILLVALSVVSYFLLKSQHAGWAFVTSGIPAIIVVMIAIFTFSQGRGS